MGPKPQDLQVKLSKLTSVMTLTPHVILHKPQDMWPCVAMCGQVWPQVASRAAEQPLIIVNQESSPCREKWKKSGMPQLVQR
jgi:hypothetical protein